MPKLTIQGLFALTMMTTLAAPAAYFGSGGQTPVTANSPLNYIARATAIAVLTGNENMNTDGSMDLDFDPPRSICPSEPLSAEPTLSYTCTGFLIAPDLLVTAGHCVYANNTENHELVHETGLACQVFDWLFDYQQSIDGKVQTRNIPASRLFHCKEIIYAKQIDTAPYDDYALIRLDRPVTGRFPLQISTQEPKAGDAVLTVGYPLGTTAKLSDHAQVLLNDPARGSFITNLNALEGNSGSPVLNAAHKVVGILIGGTPAWGFTPNDPKNPNQCKTVNRCDLNGENCTYPDADTSVFPGFQRTGTEIQKIAPIVNLPKRR